MEGISKQNMKRWKKRNPNVKLGVVEITSCPECNNYLARSENYKFCMYCGWAYDITKLKVQREEEK